MSKTEKTLNKLTEQQEKTLALFKTFLAFEKNKGKMDECAKIKHRTDGYLMALVDLNLITDSERRLLYTWVTL